MQRSAAGVAQVSLWSQRAVLNATYSSLRMRPHAFKMPLQVKLKVLFVDTGGATEEQTIEFPDDATVFKVKEWASEQFGDSIELKVFIAMGSKVLKDEELLSSDPKFLNLWVRFNHGGG